MDRGGKPEEEFTLKAAAFLALLVAAQFTMAVMPRGHSPYLSALSDLSAQAALATPACNEKTCAKEPGRGPRCLKASGVNCVVKNGCFSSAC